MTGSREDASRRLDDRAELARTWDGLVDQVRRLGRDYEDFLRPPAAGRLVEAAAAGPVVVVNVSRWRCDALVVDRGGVRPVPLPALTAGDVHTRTGAHLSALRDLGESIRRHRGLRRDGSSPGRDAEAAVDGGLDRLESGLDSLLRWLWDTIAAPVLEAVAAGGARPRLWWCPTGLLALLPLHAAGYHGSPGDNVLDRTVPSYTPTLEALTEARRPLEATDPGRMLLVAAADSPQHGILDAERRERRAVAAAFPGRLTVLSCY